MPNPEVILKGILDKAIILIFSPEVYRAITIYSIYKKELEKGSHITEYILIILIDSPNKGAIIKLFLSLKGGIQIRNKLYI